MPTLRFLITVSFRWLADLSRFFTYGMQASFAVRSFLFVFSKVPETNGMSLEGPETVSRRRDPPSVRPPNPDSLSA